jgi:chromosome partitioning protein
MNTLAIMNQKGGVGKTTTAITLAHGAARVKVRVLLVDLDAQANCSIALGLPPKPNLQRFLADDDRYDAIVPTGRPNLDLLPGDKTTAAVKAELASIPFRETILARKLARLANDYDLIILDTSPSIDLLQISALVASTHYLIPVSCQHLAAAGAAMALSTVAALSDAGALDTRLLGLLPTFYDRRTTESTTQLRELADQYGRLLLPPIPIDTKAAEAPAHGQTLYEYAPNTRALVGIGSGVAGLGGYNALLDLVLMEVAA